MLFTTISIVLAKKGCPGAAARKPFQRQLPAPLLLPGYEDFQYFFV